MKKCAQIQLNVVVWNQCEMKCRWGSVMLVCVCQNKHQHHFLAADRNSPTLVRDVPQIISWLHQIPNIQAAIGNFTLILTCFTQFPTWDLTFMKRFSEPVNKSASRPRGPNKLMFRTQTNKPSLKTAFRHVLWPQADVWPKYFEEPGFSLHSFPPYHPEEGLSL